MRILWLVNQVLPAIAQKESMPVKVTEGWLVGLSQILVKREVELIICFPQMQKAEMLAGEVADYRYYGFCKEDIYSPVLNTRVVDQLDTIITQEQPDIIHIMGCEFSHATEMWEVCKGLGYQGRVVVSIQGLISKCADMYMGGLPEKVFTKKTLRDILLRDGLTDQQKKVSARGDLERILLAEVCHVIGRTAWDHEEAMRINPNVHYYKNNENLRTPFYQKTWDVTKCEMHRIFVGQVTYPLKGFHFILEALVDVKRKYPDTVLYVAGRDISKKKPWLRTYYQKYLLNYIRKHDLGQQVVFLGELSAEQMCEQYLKANVFVLPSAIENSSNALGEAMILGTPCVASNVGGTPTMLVDSKEGVLYPFEQADMLADAICQVFEQEELAVQRAKAAREHARKTHDCEKNCDELLAIYERIVRKDGDTDA